MEQQDLGFESKIIHEISEGAVIAQAKENTKAGNAPWISVKIGRSFADHQTREFRLSNSFRPEQLASVSKLAAQMGDWLVSEGVVTYEVEN